LQSVAAVFSASLLGIGLAYCACTLLVPAAGHQGNSALADDRSPGVICSSDRTSPQAVRAGE
jgi:hypothetical protein